MIDWTAIGIWVLVILGVFGIVLKTFQLMREFAHNEYEVMDEFCRKI